MDRGTRRRGPEGEEVCAEDTLAGLTSGYSSESTRLEDSGACSPVAFTGGLSLQGLTRVRDGKRIEDL